MAANNWIAWAYNSDDGREYRVKALKELTDQGQQGGAPASASVPVKPASIKMRRCTVSDGLGHSRVVPLYSLDAPLIGTAGVGITVTVSDVATLLTGDGSFLPESKRRSTKQST